MTIDTRAGSMRDQRAASARTAFERADRLKTSASRAVAPGLYDRSNDRDACGVGFIANLKGERSRYIIESGLQILENLTHRGATAADPA
jgi:glutamate synthase (NADPH/NADH) large chain